jgi:hypothetical protein
MAMRTAKSEQLEKRDFQPDACHCLRESNIFEMIELY